jgi:hypothetical protein
MNKSHQTSWFSQTLAGAAAIISLVTSTVSATAQATPPSPSDWPASVNSNAAVDYCIFDPNNAFNTPPGWNNVMSLAPNNGDQTYAGVTLNGLFGDQIINPNGFLNVADPNYANFVNVPVIDVLLQVYGSGYLYANPLSALEGQVGSTTTLVAPPVSVPPGANNSQWVWMLLEVTNPPDQFGHRTVGDTSFPTTFEGNNGGVNLGTIRFSPANSWTVRAIAFGPQGAFGTTNQINVFAPSTCPPEPAVNLAYVDFNQDTSNNLTVINNSGLGETYQIVSGVGPAGDRRTAIQSTSGLMNFGILSNYLGLPCNTPLTMQVCLEVYDDPALAGSTFAPYQYAADSQGDLANYSGFTNTLTGSGQWLKVGFLVPSVDLQGVNTTPLTGGPTVVFNGGLPYIDRVELGVIRTGTNALAGLTPDPAYHIDPFICLTNYGYYAEWNPSAGVFNNVDAGYPTIMAGPTNDLRLSEAGQFVDNTQPYYLQFELLNEVFGPNQQDNMDVTMIMTYYDDPALVGDMLYPQIYQTWAINGVSGLALPPVPYNTVAVLQGSGQWKDAYFEIPNANLLGVYGNPQSVCRYAATGPVCVSRVRYDVIRPCGPFEGINMLQTIGITNTSTKVNVNWRGTGTLQAAAAVAGLYGKVVTVTNTLANTYTTPGTNDAQFFRLQYPAYPSYLFPPYVEGLIQNGGFGANASLFTQWPGYVGYGNPPNPAGIMDWTQAGGNVGVNGRAVTLAGSPFGPANSSDYTYAFIQGVGGLSQNLTLAASTTYKLNFAAAARSGETADVFQVQIGDTSRVYVSSGNVTGNDAAFSNYSYTFTTPATITGTPSILLQNISSSGGGGTVDFSNVGLTAVTP